MQLILSEDQELIAKTALDYMNEKSPVSRMRALRDAKDETGFSRELWKEMAELGWVGITLPESFGGAGMGIADLAIVLEATGRVLAPEPFLSTLLLGSQVLLEAGNESQQALLSEVASGDKLLALAYQEAQSRYDLNRVTTRAKRQGDAWRLDGEKVQVLDGHVADLFVVVARTSGGDGDAEGISLFLVPSDAKGLDRRRQQRVDSRGAAIVTLSSVELGSDALVGAEGQGAALLESVVDFATAGLCAEMLGGMQQAFDDMLVYLKEREQFGTVIGSFQGLKHRAARLFIEIEHARSAVMGAARAIDEGSPDAPLLVSAAKAQCSDAYVAVANESIQMHGGVGMTDEYDVGFYLKRARAAEMTFGDAAWHRDRWARLSGY